MRLGEEGGKGRETEEKAVLAGSSLSCQGRSEPREAWAPSDTCIGDLGWVGSLDFCPANGGWGSDPVGKAAHHPEVTGSHGISLL